MRYPEVQGNRFAVKYVYTKAGYLHYVADNADSKVLWAAKAMNAAGQVTDEQLGNGVETESVRNDATGWLLGRTSTAHADGDTVIQDLGYVFDEAGNLRARQRMDGANGVVASETFGYDSLDRLLSAEVKTPAQGYDPESYTYDALGNLQTKAGKNYKYGTGCLAGSRTAGPHAVCQIDDGPTYSYDGNGNLLSVGDRTVEWNAANKATRLTSGTGSGTRTADFIYGADGQRVVQAVGVGAGALGSTSNQTLSRTVYVGLGGTGKSVYERTTRGSTIDHSHFVYAGAAHGGSAFAIKVVTEDSSSSSTTERTEFHHFDHLGSVVAVSDDRGRITSAAWGGSGASVIGYDPWGALRSPSGQSADPATFASPAGNRGFTDQEAIPSLTLVNMNGRIYDPTVGRFLSPDPNVRFASDLQSYNRYSYAADNPLRYTDPTGYGFAEFWNSGFGIFVTIVAAVVATYACEGNVGCGYAVAVGLAALNTTAAIAAGVPWEDAVMNGGMNLVAGMAFGSLGAMAGGTSPLGQLVGGAIGGGLAAAYMTPVTGGSLGKNFLMGASYGALAAGVSVAASATTPVSQETQMEQQGGGPNVRTSPLADPNDATAHLLSRQIDTSQLPWYARAAVWATDASHSGWMIENEDGGAYLVEGGCPECTPQGQGGHLQASVTRYDTVDDAYNAFATDYGKKAEPVSVYEHGSWSVSNSDYNGIVNRFNGMEIPYNYASTNRNYFANWFGTQAGIPITTNPTGSWYMPGPWLYQWNYANDATGR